MKVGLGTVIGPPATARDHGAGELGLARTEIALEQHDVAQLQLPSKTRRERSGCREIGQDQAEPGLFHARKVSSGNARP